MMEDLRNKSIDAALVSIPMCKNMIEENNGIYSILETIDSNMQFNMVFHEGSPLRDEVNNILDEMIQDGTYQKIYDNWFSLQ